MLMSFSSLKRNIKCDIRTLVVHKFSVSFQSNKIQLFNFGSIAIHIQFILDDFVYDSNTSDSENTRLDMLIKL